MSDPVISPDGKWMWTGNEWIPAPPSDETINSNEKYANEDLIAEENDLTNDSKNTPYVVNDFTVSKSKKPVYVIAIILLLSSIVSGYFISNRESNSSNVESSQEVVYTSVDDVEIISIINSNNTTGNETLRIIFQLYPFSHHSKLSPNSFVWIMTCPDGSTNGTINEAINISSNILTTEIFGGSVLAADIVIGGTICAPKTNQQHRFSYGIFSQTRTEMINYGDSISPGDVYV